jgi:hypothetical protein
MRDKKVTGDKKVMGDKTWPPDWFRRGTGRDSPTTFMNTTRRPKCGGLHTIANLPKTRWD